MWDNVMPGYGGGWMGFGPVFMVLFWIVLIVGIVALVKWTTGERRTGNGGPRGALELLRERYARGEIDREEYRQKLDDLREGR